MTGYTAQDIYTRQQTSQFTDLLKASTALHGAVEWLDRARWALSGLVAALAVAGIFVPVIRNTTGIIGALVTLATALLWPQLRARWQKDATDVQEQFDTELFLVVPPSAPSRTLDPKIISRWTHRGPKTIDRPWYFDIRGIPTPVAQALCQYENTLWDAGLRTAWATTCKVLFAILGLGLIGLGVLLQLSLLEFVVWVAVPMSSLLATILSGFYQQTAAIRERQAIHDEIVAEIELIHPTASPERVEVLRGRLAGWQEAIYRSRLSSVRVPSWFHRIHRDRDERDFAADAAQRREAWRPELWGGSDDAED